MEPIEQFMDLADEAEKLAEEGTLTEEELDAIIDRAKPLIAAMGGQEGDWLEAFENIRLRLSDKTPYYEVDGTKVYVDDILELSEEQQKIVLDRIEARGGVYNGP